MSSTEYVKNIKLLNLIGACKKQSRTHSRLPFGPNDTDIILDTETVERRNRAKMFGGAADVMEANELNKLGITDKGHELTSTDLYDNKINELQTKLTHQINITSALMTERATALAAMGAFVSDDIAEKAHTLAEQNRDIQADVQSLLQITNSVLDALTCGLDLPDHLVPLLSKLEESPTLKKLNLDQYDSLL